MKIRQGFVSNSSSSSFVITKEAITDEQKEMIYNHYDYLKEYEPEEEYEQYDMWGITETEYYIKGTTNMDNFDMINYLIEFVKIPNESIEVFDY